MVGQREELNCGAAAVVTGPQCVFWCWEPFLVPNFDFHLCCTSKYSIRDDNKAFWEPGIAGEFPVLLS